MDDEARQLEVRALHDEGFNAPRRQIGSLKRKTSGVSDQLANIRAQLAARQELASSELHQRLPAVNSSVKTLPVAIETSRSVDRLRLPLLHRMERMKEVQKPPKDSFLEVHNVLQRAISQEIYVNEVEKVTTSEKTLASTLKEAEEFGEEARKRMVAYSQNESGWKFEERTVRYQQVMEMKQKADKSQQEADIKQELVVEMKKLLRDPYKALRAEDLNRKMLLSAPSALDELFSRRKEVKCE
ncbi:hypothetical protein PHYBOEH_007277 [Phytophthora boehmeriae]|uniref:Uncharacterized protein n=1 Tax=Phytophthora boehmeriae TaxID=109152 RepID=A0A8T1XDH0_9STRA|nr:hypothetical protein PHYBOEH_007277 [Phytophthora boehmeriae]